jgi:hypothetical protein
MNECDPRSIPALLDNISTVDRDVPFVWNDDKLGAFTKMVGVRDPGVHAYAMLHYRDLGCDRAHNFAGGVCAPQPMLGGLGECAWCVEHGLESYAAIAIEARQFDIAYIAGWDLINYWPNFLQGMSYGKHAWKQTACVSKDRIDGVDGWNSSVVRWVQQGIHPYAVYDVEAYRANPRWTPAWPAVQRDPLPAGSTMSRELLLFNDVVGSADIESSISLRWSAAWDTAMTLPVQRGVLGPFSVLAGYHHSVNLSLTLPTPPAAHGKLWLTMESVAGSGNVLFVEDRIFINVTRG